MSHTRVCTDSIQCDLNKCEANFSYQGGIGNLLPEWAEKAGWRRALSTSPHPQPSGVVAWAITIHFCPVHAEFADNPDTYTIGNGRNGPSYVVVPR